MHSQTVFYVSPAGNDKHDESEAIPWQTLQKASDAFVPGSRVPLHAGVYNEKVTMNVSGSADSGFIDFEPIPGDSGTPASRS